MDPVNDDMHRSYSESSYDGYLCLKPPLLLWLAMLYLSRGLTLPIVMAIASFSGVDERAISFCRAAWSVRELVPSGIAAIVLYALVRRAPAAPASVRWIWANGRVFLCLAALIDLTQTLVATPPFAPLSDQAMGSWAAAAADAYFLLYVAAARRVRDTLAEFPLFGGS